MKEDPLFSSRTPRMLSALAPVAAVIESPSEATRPMSWGRRLHTVLASLFDEFWWLKWHGKPFLPEIIQWLLEYTPFFYNTIFRVDSYCEYNCHQTYSPSSRHHHAGARGDPPGLASRKYDGTMGLVRWVCLTLTHLSVRQSKKPQVDKSEVTLTIHALSGLGTQTRQIIFKWWLICCAYVDNCWFSL